MAQLVNTPTCGSSILDLIITQYCGTVCCHPPLGTSDHVSLLAFFSLSLEIIAPPPPRKVFHWRSAPWPHIFGHFRRLNWDHVKDGSVDDATTFVTSSLINAQNRYVLSSIPTLRRPTVWWNRHCQRTYLTKLRLWNTDDSNAFRRIVRAAQLAQACALKNHKRQLQEKLRQGSSDRVWWQTIKSISGICASSTRSAPDERTLGNFLLVSLH